MITIAETRFDALRARFATALNAQLATQLERPHWDSERIAEHQRSRLRALLMRATEHSPFHAERLRGIAPERFELEQLPQLPVMSKEQMMAGFDELVTDRRITRANVERHLAAYAHEPGLLFGEYVCLVSGGSSGVRGIFVQTLDEFTAFGASVMRRMMARAIAAGGPPPEGMLVGLVAAPAPIHSSGLAGALCTAYPVRIVSAPATLPVPEIVRRLNDTQPPAIIGTPSKLALLATERRGGRLRIAPSAITTVSEVLAAEDRAAIEEAFAVRVVDGFVSTEGLAGGSDPGSAVVNFASDQCIVELVDIDNRPVPEGVESAKVLVTNLHNFTQPLKAGRYVPLAPAH